MLGRGIAADHDHAELVSALPADDECDSNGVCALHALQVRSRHSHSEVNETRLHCANFVANASNLHCANDSDGTLFRCESEGEDGAVKVKECGAGLCREKEDDAFCVEDETTTDEPPQQSKPFECENYRPGKTNFFCLGDAEGTIVSCMKKGAAGAVKFQKCGEGKCKESLETYGHNAFCLASATAADADAAVEANTDAITEAPGTDATTKAATDEATDTTTDTTTDAAKVEATDEAKIAAKAGSDE